MQDRRFGYFQIHHDLMDTRPDIVRLIQNDVIILEAGWKDTENIAYLGHHPDFELVPVGADIPWYIPDVTFLDRTFRLKWVQTSQPKPKPRLNNTWTQADMTEAVNFEAEQSEASLPEYDPRTLGQARVVDVVPPERLTDPFERQKS